MYINVREHSIRNIDTCENSTCEALTSSKTLNNHSFNKKQDAHIKKKNQLIKKKNQLKITASDKRWLRLMKLGEKTGCHQRYDRSFVINNRQFPICARCTGVLLAYIVSISRYVCKDLLKRSTLVGEGSQRKNNKLRDSFAILGGLSMLIDWLIQALDIQESTNGRRFMTGILGGFGLMHYYHKILIKILSILKHKSCKKQI